MVDINEVYDAGEHLKAADIGTSMPTFTMGPSSVKDFDNGDRKLVVSFQDTDKTLVLNVTNARAIADMYGHNSDGWVGRKIMLFTMPVEFNGNTVQAIRVRAPVDQAQNTQQQHGAPANIQQGDPGPGFPGDRT